MDVDLDFLLLRADGQKISFEAFIDVPYLLLCRMAT